MKNAVYAIIIVVCLTVTGIVLRAAHSDHGIPNSLQTWVKCLNCGDTHQMSLKSFWKQQRARRSSGNGPPSPFLTCAKCGKDAVVEAFKCPKCGEISRRGSAGPTGYDDRCPKCGFSQLEADARAKVEENQS
jgi:predicted RNA-binding Zn-ribbon protein involved in translation (DUF1610 family)